MKERIVLMIAFLSVVFIAFVSSVDYPAPFVSRHTANVAIIPDKTYPLFTNSSKINQEYIVIYPNGTKRYVSEEEQINSKECKNKLGCWDFQESVCRDLGYISNKKYCGIYYIHSFERTGFLNQKIIGENCTNDFECRSNICNSGKCEQEKGIITKEIKKDSKEFITEIFVEGKDTFYFRGLDNIAHSIKIGSEEHLTNIILDNKEFNISKIVNISKKSFIILNKILIDNGTSKVNLTFYETKDKFNNLANTAEMLLNESLNKEKTKILKFQEISFGKGDNKSLEQLNETKSISVESGTVEKDESIIKKFLDWIKDIFK